MRILSVRKGFLADHSSTSYEFLAVDMPLDSKARAAVSRLSSRVRPSARTASFIYHGDFSDLPGGWEQLMAKYYDVMYSESYDWWTLALAFDTKRKDLVARLKKYAFRGHDDLGCDVECRKNRVVVTIHCRLDPGMDYSDAELDEWEDEEDEDSGLVSVADDSLLGLLTGVRGCLKNGDCQPLYAVWEKYGSQDDEAPPPKPRKAKAGASIAAKLGRILDRA